jgi:hypothetical protein
VQVLGRVPPGLSSGREQWRKRTTPCRLASSLPSPSTKETNLHGVRFARLRDLNLKAKCLRAKW